MINPKSNNLFHFTKSADYLKNILLNGFFPRYCLEDIEWLKGDHLAYPMVCFCDIPLSRISEHTDFYGNYGVGLSKEWGLKNQLNPVIYSHNDGIAASVASYLLDVKPSNETQEEKLARTDMFFKILKIVKPLSGKMYIGGGLVDKEFYQESEWRYTVSEDNASSVFKDEFDNDKDRLNKAAEAWKIEFAPSDIKYIFVKDDSDIPALVDFINNNLGKYPLNDLKILNSRIISLETIRRDL